MKDIDEFKSNFSELQIATRNVIGMAPPMKNEPKPHNLRVTNELAEYAFEELVEKETKISQEEYEEFKKKYHRMVFDKKGNYLYTKLEPKS